MAQFTITVPDTVVPRLREAYAARYSYQEQIPDPANPGTMIANPETLNQFTTRMIRDQMKQVLAEHEAQVARNAAAEKAATDFGT